jgi:hypothetical protein
MPDILVEKIKIKKLKRILPLELLVNRKAVNKGLNLTLSLL